MKPSLGKRHFCLTPFKVELPWAPDFLSLGLYGAGSGNKVRRHRGINIWRWVEIEHALDRSEGFEPQTLKSSLVYAFNYCQWLWPFSLTEPQTFSISLFSHAVQPIGLGDWISTLKSVFSHKIGNIHCLDL